MAYDMDRARTHLYEPHFEQPRSLDIMVATSGARLVSNPRPNFIREDKL